LREVSTGDDGRRRAVPSLRLYVRVHTQQALDRLTLLAHTDCAVGDAFRWRHVPLRHVLRTLHPQGFVCPRGDGMSIWRFLRSWTIVDAIDASICR